MENPGETHGDKVESSEKVRQLRAQRAIIQSELNSILATEQQPKHVPTAEQLSQVLAQFEEVLQAALTGGKVVLSQQGKASHHGGWLRGTFQLSLVGTLLERAGHATDGATGQEVVIDFREPEEFETMADAAVELMNTGLLIKEIAVELSRRVGHGNVMMVMGGGVQGGKVYGQWPGLATEQLDSRADLAVTTDFRAVLAEVMTDRFGLQEAGSLFPGLGKYARLGLFQPA